MSRFTRCWMLRLNLSKEEFINSFHKVVRKDGTFVLVNPYGLANNFSKDFFGSIRQQSFTIWKRSGFLDKAGGGLVLEGKIIDQGDTMQLDLKVVNNFLFNYFSMILLDIVVTFFFLLVFNTVTGISSHLFGLSQSVYMIATGILICCIVHYFHLKLIDKYLDYRKNLYEKVLFKIEATSRTKPYSG